MPLAPNSPQRNVITARTRRRFEDQQPLDHLRMVIGQVVCDRPTPVMTSESEFVVSQSCDELINIRRQRSFVIARERTFAVAQAAQIRRD